MSEVLVVGSESYTGTQANLNTALGTTLAPVTLVISTDNTMAGTYAQTWAVANGVPFIDLGYILPGIGYDTIRAPLAAIYMTTPTNVLTCGTHARTLAASGAAAALGKTLTQI